MHRVLDEFLRFRHFKRYYFELEYDREKMLYLEKKFVCALDLAARDLAAFGDFLGELERRGNDN